MYTKSLKEMKSGEVDYKFSPVDYDKLHAARTKLKRKEEFSEWAWNITLCDGKVTVTRTS